MPLPAVRGVLPFAVAVLSAWLVVIAASAAKMCPKHVRARAQDGCRSSWLDPCSAEATPVCCDGGAMLGGAPCYPMMAATHMMTSLVAWPIALLPLLPSLLAELWQRALLWRCSQHQRSAQRSGAVADGGGGGGGGGSSSAVAAGADAAAGGRPTQRLFLYLCAMTWRAAVYQLCVLVLKPLLLLALGGAPSACWYEGRWGLGRCKGAEFSLSDHVVLFVAHYFAVLAHEWDAAAAAAAQQGGGGGGGGSVLAARAAVLSCGAACLYQLYFTARFFHSAPECVSAVAVGVLAVLAFVTLWQKVVRAVLPSLPSLRIETTKGVQS